MSSLDSSSIFCDNTVLSAAICSHVAYAINTDDVEQCLKEWVHYSSHTSQIVSSFHRILVSKNCGYNDPSFLVVHTSDTTYVAFCGPPSHAISVEKLSDFIDFNYDKKAMNEVCGYAIRVAVFDHIPLACLAQGVDSRRIIFCGHSLGGAFAHSVQLQYFMRTLFPLETHTESLDPFISYSMHSIAFGSPHFCDDSASRWLKQSALCDRFITIVNGDDPVPDLFENVKLALKGSGCSLENHEYEAKNLFNISPWLNVCEIREEKMTQKFMTALKKMKRSFCYVSSDKMHKKSFFSSTGTFIRLNSKSLSSQTMVKTDTHFTQNSLHQHMLLGTSGYASQIIQQYSESNKICTEDENNPTSLKEKRQELPLVMRPMPLVELAILDDLFEGGRPCITLYGKNLFYLLKNPIVFRESDCRFLETLGIWRVISYSNAGTSLKIAMDTPYPEDLDLSLFQDLKVKVITAFGMAKQRVVQLEYESEVDRYMACNMWTECMNSLSEYRSICTRNPELTIAIERCLANISSIIKVAETGIDGRVFDLEKLSTLTSSEFNFIMHPLTYGVLYYVGKQWVFEVQQKLIQYLASTSGLLQFEDGEIAEVIEGIGSIDVASVKLHLEETKETGLRGPPSHKFVRMFSRSKILVLLYTFIAGPMDLSVSELILLNDAEKEAELVALALDDEKEGLIYKVASDEFVEINALLAKVFNPHSIFSLNNDKVTIVEAMKRIQVLVEVYRLYSLLQPK